MKTTIKITLTISILIGLFACKKSTETTLAAAGTINVTNAVIGGSTITLMTNPSLISSSNTVGSNAGAFFPLVAGNTQINLGVPAVPATLNGPAIAPVSYYSQPLSIDNHSSYSLFLTGTSPAKVDNV
ncbi:MAG: hypothetical protein JWQ57_963, partial [Mucilaginibacter sp.]|nr:hypothetical protein [Mucilaginibacter sp.]